MIMPFQIYLLILFCMGLIPKIIVIDICFLKDIALVSSFYFLVSDLAFYSLVSDPKFLNRTELPQWFWFIYIVFYYTSSAIVVLFWLIFVKAGLEVPHCFCLWFGVYYLPFLNKKFLSSHFLSFIFGSTTSEKAFFGKLNLITF